MKTKKLLLIILVFASQFAVAQSSGISFSDDNGNEFRHSTFQFSLIAPPLSTNGIDFYRTINDASFNTFLGISAGNNTFELGGFANVNLYYNKGFQAAGFANVNGFIKNNNDYQSGGIQLAGFASINGNNYNGYQASGFANINKSFNGLQMAGFANIALETNNAVELAGFANINGHTNNVVQLAGFANVTLLGNSKSQLSGFANVANELEGVQASGFINVAKNVKGVQLSGFINICDSIDGIPISFISIVRKNGYRSFEFSTNDWSPIQITYKMGVEKFYNIYSISKIYGSWNRYAFGFGIGHTIPMSINTDLCLELINHNEIKFNRSNINFEGFNNLIQFKPVFKRCLNNGICLNFGPTLNLTYSFSNSERNNYLQSDNIQPFWKLNKNQTLSYQTSPQIWVGFSAGISLF